PTTVGTGPECQCVDHLIHPHPRLNHRPPQYRTRRPRDPHRPRPIGRTPPRRSPVLRHGVPRPLRPLAPGLHRPLLGDHHAKAPRHRHRTQRARPCPPARGHRRPGHRRRTTHPQGRPRRGEHPRTRPRDVLHLGGTQPPPQRLHRPTDPHRRLLLPGGRKPRPVRRLRLRPGLPVRTRPTAHRPRPRRPRPGPAPARCDRGPRPQTRDVRAPHLRIHRSRRKGTPRGRHRRTGPHHRNHPQRNNRQDTLGARTRLLLPRGGPGQGKVPTWRPVRSRTRTPLLLPLLLPGTVLRTPARTQPRPLRVLLQPR